MITFLEFVCEKLMGPPAYGSSWRCPYHDDDTPSFSVNPPKQRPDGGWYAIKFRCHAGSCGMFGDEWDLLKKFYPNQSFSNHKAQLEAWTADFQQLTGRPADHNATLSSPGDRGHDPDTVKYCLSELRAVLVDRMKWWRREEVGLRTLVFAAEIADQNRVPLEAMVRLCASELIQAKQGRGVK